MSSIFFYGLFMDTALLQEMGLGASVAVPAKLQGYKIHIGKRATLIQEPGCTSYGMLIELPDDEATTLYSAPDVCDYVPESVIAVRLNDGATQGALCYNLPADKRVEGFDAAYAQKLSNLLIRLEFPESYARELIRADETCHPLPE